MTRAKLSGSLLVSKEPRTVTPPADLSTVLTEAIEKAHGGPVLVWSARPKDKAEPNAAKDTADTAHCAAAASPATDRDPSVIAGSIAAGRLDRHTRALRWTALPAMAVAVSVLAIGGFSGSLFPQPDRGKRAGDIALSVAPPMEMEKSASGGAE